MKKLILSLFLFFIVLFSKSVIVYAAPPVIISDIVSLGNYDGSISGTTYI